MNRTPEINWRFVPFGALTSLELAGEPKMSQANFVSGPKTLPIKYEMV